MEQLRYIAFLISSFACVPLLAQPAHQYKFRPDYILVSGGLVSNVLSGSEIDFQKNIHNNEMSPRTGPMFSVGLKDELNSYFYIKYEAAYIRKGNSSPNNLLWTLNLEYVSVPVKAGVQRNVNKDLKLGIEGGVSFNYSLGHSTDQLVDAFSSATKSKVSKFALGAVLCIDLEYRLASRRVLFFNPGWYHDLTPLLSYVNGNATYRAENRGWTFAIGMLFPLGN